MARVRDNAGYIGIKYSANATYQSGIWSIVEHERYAIGNPTFWNHSVLALDLLVVGGGGSGGYGRGAIDAGGGVSGVVFYKQNVPIANNTTYTIVIGAATSRATSSGVRYTGNDSSINGIFYGYSNSTIVGLGGGGGGAPNSCATGSQDNGQPGGSGGGGGNGGGGPYNAAYASGGAALQPTKNLVGPNVFIGGGYGTAGSGGWGGGGGGASTTTNSQTGGSGLQVNINGTATYYGGGGSGGGQCSAPGGTLGGGGAGGYYWNGCLPRRDGTNNLGGGGGGGGSSGDLTGGAGGSGVVILNYPNTFGLAVSTTGSPSQTYYGANIVYKFTSSGTITF